MQPVVLAALQGNGPVRQRSIPADLIYSRYVFVFSGVHEIAVLSIGYFASRQSNRALYSQICLNLILLIVIISFREQLFVNQATVI